MARPFDSGRPHDPRSLTCIFFRYYEAKNV